MQRRPSIAEMLLLKTYSQNLEPHKQTEPKRWFQSGSTETVNLGSSMKIFDEKDRERRGSLDNGYPKRKLSAARFSPRTKRWFEKSEDSVHLGSSMKLFDERHPSASRRSSHASVREFGVPMHVISHPKLPVLSENQDLTDDNRMPSIMRQLENTTSPKSSVQKTTKFNISSTDGKGESSQSNVEKRRSLSQKIVTLFDLTLLRDRIYVNMMLGMSIAVFAEINFSLLTPFILNDLGYETEQIASIMSTLAVADLMFRFISPFIGDSLKLTPRVMYMIALSLLILTRFSKFLMFEKLNNRNLTTNPPAHRYSNRTQLHRDDRGGLLSRGGQRSPHGLHGPGHTELHPAEASPGGLKHPDDDERYHTDDDWSAGWTDPGPLRQLLEKHSVHQCVHDCDTDYVGRRDDLRSAEGGPEAAGSCRTRSDILMACASGKVVASENRNIRFIILFNDYSLSN